MTRSTLVKNVDLYLNSLMKLMFLKIFLMEEETTYGNLKNAFQLTNPKSFLLMKGATS